MNCKWCLKPLEDVSYGRIYHVSCAIEKERRDERVRKAKKIAEYRKLHPRLPKPIKYDEEAFKREWEEAKHKWEFHEENIKANQWEGTL